MNISEINNQYVTVSQAAEMLSLTRNRIGRLCLENKFEGAGKVGEMWLIPRESVENYTREKPGPKKYQAMKKELEELRAQLKEARGNVEQ